MPIPINRPNTIYNRSQGANESIADFVAGLKACAHTCQFGESLKEMLRDRLICGIKNESTQKALITEADLTFERAVEVATAREAAARDVHAMCHPNQAVHNVSKPSTSNTKPKYSSKPNYSTKPNKPDKPCSGCGKNHWRKDCPYKDATCYGCNRKGHLKSHCYTH